MMMMMMMMTTMMTDVVIMTCSWSAATERSVPTGNWTGAAYAAATTRAVT